MVGSFDAERQVAKSNPESRRGEITVGSLTARPAAVADPTAALAFPAAALAVREAVARLPLPAGGAAGRPAAVAFAGRASDGDAGFVVGAFFAAGALFAGAFFDGEAFFAAGAFVTGVPCPPTSPSPECCGVLRS
ncbi:MAG TPA: hypothetical protein VES03_03280 [Motilibacterales bacterium]|nr:hypothetical protein [Motilibacterales bacterium]